MMTITIKHLPSRRLAAVEHHGCPMKLAKKHNELMSWAKAQPIDLTPKRGEKFAFAYSDPRETPAEEWQFDLALTVPQDFKLSNEAIERKLPAG